MSAEERAIAQSTPGELPLTPGEIHLWLTSYDEIEDPLLHAHYRGLLNAEEAAQEPRFHFARDRRRYLVTRALVRTVLSRYASIAPADWIFKTNAYGRPEIANVAAQRDLLTFNISHTHSLIVLAVTRQRELGVDVENVEARNVPMDIADRYFAPGEVTTLMAAPAHEQQYRFFEYWTFKEAYIKARGMGLSLPLDKFSFQYPGARAVEIAIDPELADVPDRWQFWQFRPEASYLVALCAERLEGSAPAVVVRRTVPLMSEQHWAPVFLRTSEQHCERSHHHFDRRVG
ncbi:MAG: 4'-phosphopantetheinyl transferase superfamily protein [Acidobacteriota bacterium]